MDKTISYYLNQYKELRKNKSNFDKKIKIALLSSFTTKGIKETLTVQCSEIGVEAEIYEANYNQYVQEILNDKSGLYSSEPDLVILLVDYQSIAGDLFFSPYSHSDKQRKDFVKSKVKEITSLIETVTNKLNSKILLHNFCIPTYSPYGIVEDKQPYGHIEMVQDLNSRLRNQFKDNNQVFVFDFESFCSEVGKNSIFDLRMYYLGDIKISLDKVPFLCFEYLGYIKPMLSLSKKCIVLDLDNTLWGGVVGEDGIDGIALGPTPEGRSFMEFQKYLLGLFDRGVILAVNSKNNEADALEVFKNHPHMILKEKHFASMQINWNDKATNIRAIAEDINIGTDSLVFFDDDAMNRDLVSNELPEVLVVDMPKDPALYVQMLHKLTDFNVLSITADDKKKGQMYAAQRKRKDFEAASTDLSSYLKGLNMKLTIEKANASTFTRISQLSQKTNQFNMTTRRYLEEEIVSKSENKDWLIVSISLIDKFGDNGTVGVAIVEKKSYAWRIDTFLLSCRIIGRQVEEALLSYICRQSMGAGVDKIIGEFIPTKKNALAKDFYQRNLFSLAKTEKDVEQWERTLKSEVNYPTFIEVIEK